MLSEILTRQTAKPARIDRAERFRNIPETTEPVAGYKAERTAILEMKKEYGDDMAQVAELNREWKDSDIKKWCDEWDRYTGAVAQIDAGLRWLEDLTDEAFDAFPYPTNDSEWKDICDKFGAALGNRAYRGGTAAYMEQLHGWTMHKVKEIQRALEHQRPAPSWTPVHPDPAARSEVVHVQPVFDARRLPPRVNR